MMSEPRLGFRAAMNIALALVFLFLAGWALLYHADVWSFPQQVEPTEGGLMLSTRAVLDGKDPWAVELAPVYSNNYGIGFPWAAAFASRLAPRLPLLQVLRMVTMACIFLILGLLYLTWRDQGVDPMTALAGCLVVYIPLLLFDIPAGRPDALATLLYLISLLAVLRPGLGAALLAGALPALGYFVKPYALLAFGLGALHLARQRRWRHLGVFLAAGVLTGLGLAGFVLHGHPYYFDGTYFILAASIDYQLSTLLAHFKILSLSHFPLALVVLGAAWTAHRRGLPWKPQGAAADWGFFSLLCFAVMLAGPGWHAGAHMRYFNELFIPLAILFLVLWARQLGVVRWLLLLGLLGNAALCRDYHRRYCYTVSAEDYAGWVQAGQWMDSHPRGIYPPLMTALAFEHHAYIFNTDHSQYLPYVKPFGRPSPIAQYAQKRLDWFMGELAQRRLQTVVCGAYNLCPPGLEDKGYHVVDHICLRTPMARNRVCFAVYVPK
jgi:hypothetical protein